jgi:hypothetical protein
MSMDEPDLRQAAQDALDALKGFGYYGRSPGWWSAVQGLEEALGKKPSHADAQAIAHYQAIEAIGKSRE